MGEQFYLKWNNHQNTLIGVFDTLLGTEKYADCILAAEGRVLKAHKVVLSACSPYLEYLLNQQGTDKHPILIFNDIKFNELKAMLDYMYKGEVNVLQEQFNSFLKAAKSLQVKGLTDQGGGGGGGETGSGDDGKRKAGKDGGSPREGSTSPVPPRKRRKRRPSQESPADCPPLVPPSPSPPVVTRTKIETDRISNSSAATVAAATPPLAHAPPPQAPPPPPLPPPPSLSLSLFQAKTEPGELILQPKTEYLNDDQPVEDLTIDDEEEDDLGYMGNPATSLGENSQDYNSSWQLGDQGTEAFLAAQEAMGNQNNSQEWLTNGERVKRDHSYVQEAAVRCDNCGKLYRHRRHLKRHVLMECGKEPQLKCPLCPYKSLRQTTLSRHLKLKH